MKLPPDLIRQIQKNQELRFHSRESISQPKMDTSLLEHPGIKVIITLETSGEFLTKIMRACQATGLTVDQLFEYLSREFMARLYDSAIFGNVDATFPPPLMMDSRIPKTEEYEINEQLAGLVDSIENNARFINRDNVQNVKLIEVNKDNEWAIIEIKPRNQNAVATDLGDEPKQEARGNNKPPALVSRRRSRP